MAFQIDSICTQNTDYDIINSLKNLPKGLPATFTRILRRLKHSPFADPSLGRKIFEIIVAAQRPLTLDELGEAISIVPGETTWDTSKSINSIFRSLESCGSLIVVDEELSTVHFAHSSVRRYLVSEPTDIDVQDYHVDPSEADLNLGKLAVTYLSLDVLGSQLVRIDGPSQLLAAEVPSFVVRSTLPKNKVVNKMALAILRGRKKPSNDSNLDLERNANAIPEKTTARQEGFSFLPYCQEYWLFHSSALHVLEGDRVYELWERLVEGDAITVELPWTPENLSDTGKQFEVWIWKNRHEALLRKAIRRLWYRCDIWQPAEFLHIMRQLESFLSLLPDENARHSLRLDPASPIDVILSEAVQYGYEMIAGLALHKGADINGVNNQNKSPLYVAVLKGNISMAQLLIQKGADVNHQCGDYGNALQAAAVGNHGLLVELLIASGADVNAQGRKYGSALIAAIVTGNINTVHILLEAGADPNAEDVLESTALIAGIRRKASSTVELLIEKGADVNKSGSNDKSPLRMAARLRNDDIVRLLLNAGAIIDFHGTSGQDYIKEYETNIEIGVLLYTRV